MRDGSAPGARFGLGTSGTATLCRRSRSERHVRFGGRRRRAGMTASGAVPSGCSSAEPGRKRNDGFGTGECGQLPFFRVANVAASTPLLTLGDFSDAPIDSDGALALAWHGPQESAQALTCSNEVRPHGLASRVGDA